MNRKAQMPLWVWVVIGLVAFAIVSGGVIMGVQKAKELEVVPSLEEVEGEFTDIFLPKEVSGTDLEGGKIVTVTSEQLGTISNGTTKYFSTANTPLVVNSETVYNGTIDLTTTDKINYTVEDYDTGNISVKTASDTCVSDCTINTDYDWEDNSVSIYNETDNDFSSYLLTSTVPSAGTEVSLSYSFEIDDLAEDLSISGTVENSGNLELRDVYLLPDEEGNNLDVDDSITKADVDDTDEFDLKKTTIEEGEYVLVMDAKAVNDLSEGTTIFDTVDFDLEGGDRDKGTTKISVGT